MTETTNQFGQPVGQTLAGWTPRPLPGEVVLKGRFCRIERLDPARHARALHAAYSTAPDGRDWTYLGVGPFDSFDGYYAYAQAAALSADPYYYTVIDNSTGQPVGTFSLMRHDPTNGVIEVGAVVFSPLLKRSPLSTEAQFLLMAYAFDTLGYRRYEWKCDSLNAPSRRAAERLGFTFEGVFRQAVVNKGRNRDTAWFSVLDGEWPRLKQAFEAWLSRDNFDAEGQQRHALQALRATS